MTTTRAATALPLIAASNPFLGDGEDAEALVRETLQVHVATPTTPDNARAYAKVMLLSPDADIEKVAAHRAAIRRMIRLWGPGTAYCWIDSEWMATGSDDRIALWSLGFVEVDRIEVQSAGEGTVWVNAPVGTRWAAKPVKTDGLTFHQGEYVLLEVAQKRRIKAAEAEIAAAQENIQALREGHF